MDCFPLSAQLQLMAFGMNNKLRINTALVAFMLLLLLLLFIVVYVADDGKHYIWLTLKLILYLLIMFMISNCQKLLKIKSCNYL